MSRLRMNGTVTPHPLLPSRHVQRQIYCISRSFVTATIMTHHWIRFTRQPKVHYRLHRSLRLFPVLSQLNLVRTHQPYFLRSILTLSSHLHLDLRGWSVEGFPTKSLCIPLLPLMGVESRDTFIRIYSRCWTVFLLENYSLGCKALTVRTYVPVFRRKMSRSVQGRWSQQVPPQHL